VRRVIETITPWRSVRIRRESAAFVDQKLNSRQKAGRPTMRTYSRLSPCHNPDACRSIWVSSAIGAGRCTSSPLRPALNSAHQAPQRIDSAASPRATKPGCFEKTKCGRTASRMRRSERGMPRRASTNRCRASETGPPIQRQVRTSGIAQGAEVSEIVRPRDDREIPFPKTQVGKAYGDQPRRAPRFPSTPHERGIVKASSMATLSLSATQS
jgi:hypothetical protein